MPRRKEETPPEMLFHILRAVPWWIGPIVIAITFAVLRFAIPALIDAPLVYDNSTTEKAIGFGGQVLRAGVARFCRGAAPWISLGIAAIWAAALVGKRLPFRKPEQKRRENRK